MKLGELDKWAHETLEIAAKCPSTGVRDILTDDPTFKQLSALRLNGYVLGSNKEVYRIDLDGMLRECNVGIPCNYKCNGLSMGCKQIKLPTCGVVDGVCLLTKLACNSHCKNNFK